MDTEILELERVPLHEPPPRRPEVPILYFESVTAFAAYYPDAFVARIPDGA
jgi:hypothetical protein